jgi:hypothetical protein
VVRFCLFLFLIYFAFNALTHNWFACLLVLVMLIIWHFPFVCFFQLLILVDLQILDFLHQLSKALWSFHLNSMCMLGSIIYLFLYNFLFFGCLVFLFYLFWLFLFTILEKIKILYGLIFTAVCLSRSV